MRFNDMNMKARVDMAAYKKVFSSAGFEGFPRDIRNRFYADVGSRVHMYVRSVLVNRKEEYIWHMFENREDRHDAG
jgi:hypothetical protein